MHYHPHTPSMHTMCIWRAFRNDWDRGCH